VFSAGEGFGYCGSQHNRGIAAKNFGVFFGEANINSA
jgi:hypothetical protein